MGQLESFGGSMPVNDQALEHIGRLIREVQPDSMIQKFVLLVETIDDEDRWLSAFCAPGQKEWDTLGMLQWALNAESRWRVVPQDEPGDDDAS